MTNEELQNVVSAIFANFDKDGKGFLDFRDSALLQDIVYSHDPNHSRNQQSAEQFATILDVNSDGFATYSDIDALMRKFFSVPKTPQKSRILEIARSLFEQFDLDKSGFIEEGEVYNLLTQIYAILGIKFSPSHSDVRSWLRMADENRDNRVSLREFEEMLTRITT